ncbi:MAG: DUF2232 domain-containing protein [Erysipelotrichaceae bacterium]|nr:DUF2232 domain-containing protein [Erysipelotrichaceae bacterium]
MNSTKKITQGAMMCAIVGAMLLLDRQLAGFIDFALFWIIPLPVVVYTAKQGTRYGAMLAFSIAVIALLVGQPSAIFYSIMATFMGLSLGWGIHKGIDQGKLFATSCIVSMISTFLSVFVFASLLGYNLVDEANYIQETLVTLTQSFGIAQVPQTLIDFIPIIVMLSFIISALLEAVLVYLLSYATCHRMKIKLTPMKPIVQIQLPKMWGYLCLAVYIASFILLMLPSTVQYSNVWYFINLVSQLILLVNGYIAIVTVLAYYQQRKLAILLLLAIVPVLNTIIVVIGFLDSVWMLRWRIVALKERR